MEYDTVVASNIVSSLHFAKGRLKFSSKLQFYLQNYRTFPKLPMIQFSALVSFSADFDIFKDFLKDFWTWWFLWSLKISSYQLFIRPKVGPTFLEFLRHDRDNYLQHVNDLEIKTTLSNTEVKIPISVNDGMKKMKKKNLRYRYPSKLCKLFCRKSKTKLEATPRTDSKLSEKSFNNFLNI
jgi:hypothetical protein